MKKYYKPEIFVEQYSMSDQICSCAIQSSTPSSTAQCGYVLDFGIFQMTLFTIGVGSACDVETSDVSGYEQYCYQPGGLNIFGS